MPTTKTHPNTRTPLTKLKAILQKQPTTAGSNTAIPASSQTRKQRSAPKQKDQHKTPTTTTPHTKPEPKTAGAVEAANNQGAAETQKHILPPKLG